MIARIWHGRTPTAKADAYLELLQRIALPDYRRIQGNVAASILRRTDGAVTHFITLTHWESLQAIERFAGADIALAKYYPEDRDSLLEFEPSVAHWEVFS